MKKQSDKGKKVPQVKPGKKLLPKSIQQIAKRLKEIRLEKGYTNAEIYAYEHKLSRTLYARYERADSDMRITSLFKILEHIKVPVADFFGKGFD